jgi:hypothetical protein
VTVCRRDVDALQDSRGKDPWWSDAGCLNREAAVVAPSFCGDRTSTTQWQTRSSADIDTQTRLTAVRMPRSPPASAREAPQPDDAPQAGPSLSPWMLAPPKCHYVVKPRDRAAVAPQNEQRARHPIRLSLLRVTQIYRRARTAILADGVYRHGVTETTKVFRKGFGRNSSRRQEPPQKGLRISCDKLFRKRRRLGQKEPVEVRGRKLASMNSLRLRLIATQGTLYAELSIWACSDSFRRTWKQSTSPFKRPHHRRGGSWPQTTLRSFGPERRGSHSCLQL